MRENQRMQFGEHLSVIQQRAPTRPNHNFQILDTAFFHGVVGATPFRCNLSVNGVDFARTTENRNHRLLPTQRITPDDGNSHDGVVERSMDMSHAVETCFLHVYVRIRCLATFNQQFDYFDRICADPMGTSVGLAC